MGATRRVRSILLVSLLALSSFSPGASGADVTAQGLAGLTIWNASKAEGDYYSRIMRFRVTLSRAARREVTVRFETVELTAKSPSDYRAKTGRLVFEPGDQVERIRIRIYGDTKVEPDERFRVRLFHPQNAEFIDRRARGTIINDDQPPPACDPAYPDVCIPSPPPDLNCGDISYRDFQVVEHPDPHGFDSDNDGLGCET